MVKDAKVDIRKFELDALIEWCENVGEKSFRAKQIYEWIWVKSATDFDSMTNLSIPLRDKLEDAFHFNPLAVDKVQRSNDGTIKSRFTLHDGHAIESVLIPVTNKDRYTVCVSTQVGCSLTCSFCATGRMKRMRNLDAAEIYDQVVEVNKQCLRTFKHPLTNLVYMGMGEPLLNYQQTLRSVELITSPKGLNWSPSRITVSTAGISKMIKKLADDEVKFNLALSLHAADDAKRDTIMPINETNNLEILIESLIYFDQRTKGKISFEYIAFKGFNDQKEDAVALANLCSHFPVKVNIIEYNPIGGVSFEKSNPITIDEFANVLRRKGVTATIRRSRGKDIDAACGQLANKD